MAGPGEQHAEPLCVEGVASVLKLALAAEPLCVEGVASALKLALAAAAAVAAAQAWTLVQTSESPRLWAGLQQPFG